MHFFCGTSYQAAFCLPPGAQVPGAIGLGRETWRVRLHIEKILPDTKFIEKSWLKLYSVASFLLDIDKLETLRELLHFLNFSAEDHMVHIKKKVLGIFPMKQNNFF